MADPLQIIPHSQPLWAVFSDLEGKPDFRPVVSIAMAESKVATPGGRYKMERAFSCVTIFPAGHLQMADEAQEFLGYSTDTNPVPWQKRAQLRRESIIKRDAEAKAAAAANKGIIVPNQKIVRAHEVPKPN